MTKGVIYGHFRSKGQLLVEVTRAQVEASDALLDVEMASSDPAAFVSSLLNPAHRELRVLQIDAAAAARHDPDVAAGMEEIHRMRVRSIITRLGDVNDPETMAYLIVVLSAGVGVQESHRRASPDAGALQRTVDGMLTAQTNGVSTGATT